MRIQWGVEHGLLSATPMHYCGVPRCYLDTVTHDTAHDRVFTFGEYTITVDQTRHFFSTATFVIFFTSSYFSPLIFFLHTYFISHNVFKMCSTLL